MAETTLLIRAGTADAVLDLLKADALVGQALRIADEAVRADIEINALWVRVGGEHFIDTTQPAEGCGPDVLEFVQRALRYIELRGPGMFPWLLKRHIDAPNLMRFVDKENRNG
ncbi:MAG: hypothetical protein WA956_05755 [Stenotrophomonas sp.]